MIAVVRAEPLLPGLFYPQSPLLALLKSPPQRLVYGSKMDH